MIDIKKHIYIHFQFNLIKPFKTFFIIFQQLIYNIKEIEELLILYILKFLMNYGKNTFTKIV